MKVCLSPDGREGAGRQGGRKGRAGGREKVPVRGDVGMGERVYVGGEQGGRGRSACACKWPVADGRERGKGTGGGGRDGRQWCLRGRSLETWRRR